MPDEWTVVAKQREGETRVERSPLGHYHLVTAEASWPLDETEGNFWEWTVEELSPAVVDYHLGNLALAHSMCLPDGKSFAQQAEEGRKTLAATKLRGGR